MTEIRKRQPTHPGVLLREVETKLSQVIKQFIDSYGFHRKLSETVRKLYEKAEESSTLPPPTGDKPGIGRPKAG